MHRRWFMFVAAATSAVMAGCGAISTNTTGPVTTLTVNVGVLKAWGQAFANGATLTASLPGITGTPAAMTLDAVAASVVADLQALAATAGPALTLTFDSTSIPSAVNALLKDGQTVLADALATVSSVATSSLTTAQTYINAVQTLVSLFEAQLSVAPVGAALKANPMSEQQALTALQVH